MLVNKQFISWASKIEKKKHKWTKIAPMWNFKASIFFNKTKFINLYASVFVNFKVQMKMFHLLIVFILWIFLVLMRIRIRILT